MMSFLMKTTLDSHRPSFTCGGNLTAESGVVGSQGYPGVYPPNTKCVWRITVRPYMGIIHKILITIY